MGSDGPAGEVSESIPVDPDLAGVVVAWPALPEHIRAAVLALVETAERGQMPTPD